MNLFKLPTNELIYLRRTATNVPLHCRGKKKRVQSLTGHDPATQRTVRQVQGCYHSDFDILHEYVRLRAPHLVPTLVPEGMNINEMNAFGLTALHVASQTLAKEAIETLLRLGARVNLPAPTTGRSALHFATRSSSSKGGVTLAAGAECVELLLQKGADVRKRDHDGKEALHFASQGGREDLVTLLLDHGADVNSLTSQGESPLFLFLEERKNLRQARLLDKLLSLSYPLKITNAKECLPTGLSFPCARRLKEALLEMASEVLTLQEICKFNIRKMYGGNMGDLMELKLPAEQWKSILVDQEFSYASKLKAFN